MSGHPADNTGTSSGLTRGSQRGLRLDPAVGCGYTLATGRLWTSFSAFHEFVEELLGRPVFTHEMASADWWEEARRIFEDRAAREFGGRPGPAPS